MLFLLWMLKPIDIIFQIYVKLSGRCVLIFIYFSIFSMILLISERLHTETAKYSYYVLVYWTENHLIASKDSGFLKSKNSWQGKNQ